MTGHTADIPGAPASDRDDTPGPLWSAEIILSRGRSAECTIFPADATGMELVTTWITAKEGSFVSLEDVR